MSDAGIWILSCRKALVARDAGISQAMRPVLSTATETGKRNCLASICSDARRQAISGPTPVSSSSTSPTGAIHLLKNGGPTVIRFCVIASDSVGNSVAVSTKKAPPRSTQLLTKNANSRDTHESSSPRDRNSGSR